MHAVRIYFYVSLNYSHKFELFSMFFWTSSSMLWVGGHKSSPRQLFWGLQPSRISYPIFSDPATWWRTSTLCSERISRRRIQRTTDWTWIWDSVASSKSGLNNTWQLALGALWKRKFLISAQQQLKTSKKLSGADFMTNTQHGRRRPEEHGEKFKFWRRMEWSIDKY